MIATDEQAMLRDAAAGWVRENAPIAALRAVRGAADGLGYDAGAYRAMAEMGWTGMVVPESDGGYGFGHVGMGMIAEQLGRTLVASPLLSSAVLCADLLVACGNADQKARWLPGLVDGSLTAALALDEGPRHDPAGVALSAERVGEDWKLTGTKGPVIDGPGAGLLIVAARSLRQPAETSGITLFLCPANTPGLRLSRLERIDSRGAAIATFDGVSLASHMVLGTADAGLEPLEAALDRTRAVLAAEMLGSAQAAFETTVEYLKTRIQFDQPIGAFQALQHRAADMLAQLEMARSAVMAALFAIDADDPDLPRLASLAKAQAGKVFRKVAQEMIQMHGGIGMTDEHDAGLYLKRAQAADMALGNVAYHRERYARLSGY